MRTKWVVTLYARINENIQFTVFYSNSIWLLSVLVLATSCDKNDDLIELAVEQETFSSNEIPAEAEINTESELFTDEELQMDSESLIIYTNVDPDFSGMKVNDFFNLDLNNDGIVDFTLSSFTDYNNEWISIKTTINGNGCLSVAPWYSNPIPLNNSDEIYSVSKYRNGAFYSQWGIFTYGDCFGGEKGCFYDWIGTFDKYLGFQFYINGKVHYGWLRLDVVSHFQWTIKDYAYNATPFAPILAGQKE